MLSNSSSVLLIPSLSSFLTLRISQKSFGAKSGLRRMSSLFNLVIVKKTSLLSLSLSLSDGEESKSSEEEGQKRSSEEEAKDQISKS